jgi:hypothetical protein
MLPFDNGPTILADRGCQDRSSIAPFLSRGVSWLHSIDDNIHEIIIDVQDPDRPSGGVSEAARGRSIAVDQRRSDLPRLLEFRTLRIDLELTRRPSRNGEGP